MSREINTELTKVMLQEMGIYHIYWDVEKDEWYVDRYWYKAGRSKDKIHKRVTIGNAKRPHKYGKTKQYPAIVFSYNGKTKSIPLARALYAWFKGDIPEGYVVDHIDNNPYNCSLNNLQLLTQPDNLRKRYQDNPNNYHNQWDALKAIINQLESQCK